MPVLYCDSSWHILHSGRAREGAVRLERSGWEIWGLRESLCLKDKKGKVNILYFTHLQYSGLNLVLAGLIKYTPSDYVFVFSKLL